ncbi:hypothetical protein [Aliikangiella coralliicola]|uniref:Uncharacterized protein n=1 Tax=Aliikangiella coralliicola TaxID=2592383 RepID=A0A545U4S0_9GAMM|nr:hypothetical protein [Aliikangiella coralliicola]TQV84469.1 hypothetical protein FLL46_22915 [Aliikangiella coralliicola]
MVKIKHQWATFHKGRMKVKACATCGELHLPSNSEKECEGSDVLDSQIVKAGYRLYGGHSSLH